VTFSSLAHALYPPVTALSPRVAEAVARTEDANEVLLGWVQAAVVTLLGALYLASPKGFQPNDVAFEPVPWVLAAYAPLVFARLVLAHRSRLGPAVLAASVVADIGVLFLLIWSFHIQYCQPASFYLKAPTFVYVFLFIALRSLRYDFRYLLLAGATACAGWMLLVGYALGPGDADVTRSFVDYAMGYPVLVGAELDKVVGIAMVTGVLAVGTVRSRRLLAEAASEGQARRELTRFFSADVAAKIVTSAEAIRPGEGELREATIVMIDLRGFTRLASTLPPDRVMQLLGDFQRRMVTVLFAHGGSVDKFLGDGILAHFGAATESGTHAADALRAVDDLMAEAEAWIREAEDAGVPDLGVGAACASGEVLFGAVGDAERLEYTVIGNAVNLAAKLEKHTKSEEVRALTSEATWTSALAAGYESAVPRRLLRARPVAGVAEPLDLVVLAERVRPDATAAAA
jgi:adenylate cyclase